MPTRNPSPETGVVSLKMNGHLSLGKGFLTRTRSLNPSLLGDPIWSRLDWWMVAEVAGSRPTEDPLRSRDEDSFSRERRVFRTDGRRSEKGADRTETERRVGPRTPLS